jgi:hypothetical protein
MIRYWIERFPLRLYVPAATLIAVAAHPAGQTIGRWLVDLSIVTLLLAQFRLWDDLADRRHDRRAHPERVLARTERAAPFVALCFLLAFVNETMAWRHATAAIALTALNATTAAWYTLRHEPRTLGDLVLLAKYPLFVLILAAGSSGVHSPVVFISMSVSLLVAVCYEAWHDPGGPLGGLLRSGNRYRIRIRARGANAS